MKKEKNKTLAFDTSSKYLSIAIFEGQELVREFHEEAGIKHSAILIPTIKSELEGLSWTVRDIDLFCVGQGPGSFTGLRIAFATVKAFAAVSQARVVGVPSIDAIARGYNGAGKFISPLLDARKGKVYSAIYERVDGRVKRITEHMLITIEDLLNSLDKNVVFFGDGIIPYRERIKGCRHASIDADAIWYPRAADIGKMGIELAKTDTHDPELLEPLYLHAKECNITLKK